MAKERHTVFVAGQKRVEPEAKKPEKRAREAQDPKRSPAAATLDRADATPPAPPKKREPPHPCRSRHSGAANTARRPTESRAQVAERPCDLLNLIEFGRSQDRGVKAVPLSNPVAVLERNRPQVRMVSQEVLSVCKDDVGAPASLTSGKEVRHLRENRNEKAAVERGLATDIALVGTPAAILASRSPEHGQISISVRTNSQALIRSRKSSQKRTSS